MLLEFSTKMNKNGNRYYLTINTDTRKYNCIPGWGDKVVIKLSDMRELRNKCKEEGYEEEKI